MTKTKAVMQKVVSALRHVNCGSLSVSLPIFILASVFILWYFFEIYIMTNTIQVVGLLRISMAVAGVLGIVLGALGFQNKASPQPKPRMKVFRLIGILLNVALLFSAYIIDVPTVKGTITDIYIDENGEDESGLSALVDLSANKFDEDFFGNPPKPVLIVHISNDTTIYERVGYWSWQNEIGSVNQIQISQYVEVKYNGWIVATHPGQIYATEITIVEDEIGDAVP